MWPLKTFEFETSGLPCFEETNVSTVNTRVKVDSHISRTRTLKVEKLRLKYLVSQAFHNLDNCDVKKCLKIVLKILNSSHLMSNDINVNSTLIILKYLF